MRRAPRHDEAQTLSVPCPGTTSHIKTPGRPYVVLVARQQAKRKVPAFQGRGAARRHTVSGRRREGHYSPRPWKVGTLAKLSLGLPFRVTAQFGTL